ncbi:MAG: helicase, partial [Lachnospiraceae bacterium]|nr:helicase [Lachnospiraceae bacterium]
MEKMSRSRRRALARKRARRRAKDKRRRERAKSRKEILATIPDRYADLYPGAREIRRHFILHIGPTNSGKTHDALMDLAQSPTGVYLGPIRLLAYEIHERLNRMG